MRTISSEEICLICGGGGLDFLNDAARALGGATARVVDAAETKLNEVGAAVKTALINYQFEQKYG